MEDTDGLQDGLALSLSLSLPLSLSLSSIGLLPASQQERASQQARVDKRTSKQANKGPGTSKWIEVHRIAVDSGLQWL